MSDGATPVERLWIRGLSADVTREELAGRFTSFGKVLDVSILTDRGFGYVNLVPSGPTAADKAISVYRNAKWRGGTLNVQRAKPDYLARLQTEWKQAAQEVELKAAELATKAVGPIKPTAPSKRWKATTDGTLVPVLRFWSSHRGVKKVRLFAYCYCFSL